MKSAKKTNWLKTTLCVLVACAVLGTVVSGIIFASDPGKTYASASVEFSFDGAANGIAPNGYTFTVADMASDEVLNKALEAAGMADRYTAAQIQAELKITGEYPKNIVEQMTSYESLLDFSANREVQATVYHPTLYSVQLSNGFDTKISKADLTALLKSILDTYKAYFAETGSVGINDVALIYNLSDYDYPQQLTILSRLMSESADYADQMYEKQPTLMLNGTGFNDISVRLRSLIDTDISRLSANVTINALTQQPRRMITQYQYYIDELNIQLARKNAEMEKITNLLNFYDKYEVIYLSTTESLTKIDGNSSETYDSLVASQKSVADQITNLETRIDTYTQRLNDLTGATAEAAAETTEAAPATAAAPQTTADTATDSAAATETASAEPTDTDTAETTAETEATPSLTEEELAALTAAAEEASKKAIQDLEADIAALVASREAVMTDFAALLKLYNDQQINDLTVAVSAVKYDSPKILSGSFIKQTLKVAGPFVAVGFIVCLILIIRSRRKEEKLVNGGE